MDTDSDPTKETEVVGRTQIQDEQNDEKEAGLNEPIPPPEQPADQNQPCHAESDGWPFLKCTLAKPYSREMKADLTMPHTPVLKPGGKVTKSLVERPGDAIYEMKSKPHGLALIISNKKFKCHKKRNGTEVDEDNLCETFRFLGYRVKFERDCSKDKMERLFDAINTLVTDNDDSFVCCILSHGSNNIVYGSDSEEVFLHTQENSLERKLVNKCPTLKGRPKLFFVSACRKTKAAPPPESDGDDSRGDLAFFYSTLPGDDSTRFPDRGTVYIEKLCDVLCRSATSMTLSNIQKKVAEEMGVTSQFPASEERLKRNVYFFDDVVNAHR